MSRSTAAEELKRLKEERDLQAGIIQADGAPSPRQAERMTRGNPQTGGGVAAEE